MSERAYLPMGMQGWQKMNENVELGRNNKEVLGDEKIRGEGVVR